MSSAPSKRHHTKISTNVSEKLEKLAYSHPFSQQVDIVFPSCERLESLLAAFTTRYGKGKANLAKLFSAGPTFVRPYASDTIAPQTNVGVLTFASGSAKNKPSPDEARPHQSSFLLLTANKTEEEVWCVDPRGVLTLCVSKETHERLGLVGQRLPFKHRAGERYVIELPLRENAVSPTNQARRLKALESWDTFRASETGIGDARGMWDVIYCAMDTSDLDKSASDIPISDLISKEVLCEKSYLREIWVPDPTYLFPEPRQQHSDEWEDWNREVASVFEWIGMVGLRAQRLQANDRTNPYVAIYEPPPSSKVGNVTHLRWRGFLSPSFVQSLIDASVEFLNAHEPSSTPELATFVSVVVHGITDSPVVYLPQQSSRTNGKGKPKPLSSSPPAHLPRLDGDDTWSLLLLPPGANSHRVRSILVENIGQWDARWG